MAQEQNKKTFSPSTQTESATTARGGNKTAASGASHVELQKHFISVAHKFNSKSAASFWRGQQPNK